MEHDITESIQDIIENAINRNLTVGIDDCQGQIEVTLYYNGRIIDSDMYCKGDSDMYCKV